MPALDWITVRGFKSIASLEKLSLRPINVPIGANGSGKSNRAIAPGNWQEFSDVQSHTKTEQCDCPANAPLSTSTMMPVSVPGDRRARRAEVNPSFPPAAFAVPHRTSRPRIAGSPVPDGTPGRTRTDTSLRTTDFESAASTNSATGARGAPNRTIRGAAGGGQSGASDSHYGDGRAFPGAPASRRHLRCCALRAHAGETPALPGAAATGPPHRYGPK